MRSKGNPSERGLPRSSLKGQHIVNVRLYLDSSLDLIETFNALLHKLNRLNDVPARCAHDRFHFNASRCTSLNSVDR